MYLGEEKGKKLSLFFSLMLVVREFDLVSWSKVPEFPGFELDLFLLCEDERSFSLRVFSLLRSKCGDPNSPWVRGDEVIGTFGVGRRLAVGVNTCTTYLLYATFLWFSFIANGAFALSLLRE